MYKKTFTHYVSKIIIDILFYMSIVCTAVSPFVTDIIFNWIGGYGTAFKCIVFLSGLACIYILFNLKQMYRTLLEGNPFVDKNISHFRKMAVTCFVVCVAYFVKCFFMFTYATAIISAIFAVGCLFCLTLKDLFKQAVNFKAENDLTI